ncbi:peptidylprolyl isomerase [Luteolibacter sp. LG18]|uniref:peptidylprolyl isomerase n=1 Tax=Luteolibacter sp. LG18 TaxID=2819286 RepID=UPI002B2E187C|nr:peptidyl-prolyl cis-trans isomerase [Luteolibacter sp. LG18]
MKRRSAIFALALLPLCSFAEEAKDKPAAEAKPQAPAKVEKVRFKTNKGEFVVELNREKAPITVENFLSYVNKKHYDGTVFHRVIPTFMIQGGGFSQQSGRLLEKAVDKPIKNEGQNGLKNLRGTIAMARTNDVDSATSQFFVNVKDNPDLDYPTNGGYAVFGKVVEGMDVVDKIKAVPTHTADISMKHPVTGQAMRIPAQDVPVEDVVIESAKAE